ncbi:TerD family protein [Flammeovirga aprica]|uniref:Prokaryotic RING finger family 4 n=1 Tax=Flammeovirga aprica JL-4 TaxID=694437 RepID=A0A7X9RZY8_9BACT|nr:hypothetical protein [Flammeovirga aprica]NME71897.1 hypothetical protein [Flammeovirga aprica JL-4]
MKNELQKVAIRNGALYVPLIETPEKAVITAITKSYIRLFEEVGLYFSNDLLLHLNAVSQTEKEAIYAVVQEILGLKKNWTPLIKEWDQPSKITFGDQVITWLSNKMGSQSGYLLPCDHVISEGTFNIDEFNGCPHCGTPFEVGKLMLKDEGKKLKKLSLWTDQELEKYFHGLLASAVALDATQVENLQILLKYFDLPEDAQIVMKETKMLVIDTLTQQNEIRKANQFFQSPNDVLRYLWYKHTGYLQLVKPKVIIKRKGINAVNIHRQMDAQQATKKKATDALKLKFSRKEAKVYAYWLNCLTMNIQQQCEDMHPNRGMWVRVIRALRLGELSKRKGYEKLAQLMDTFYNQNYTVWQGRVNHFKLKLDAEKTFSLLKQRPGLFARSLFANMLWFGPEVTLKHFKEIVNQLPSRLIYTLNMYADTYFDPSSDRVVKPLGGTSKRIPKNHLLQAYMEEDLKEMVNQIHQLTFEKIKEKLEQEEVKPHSIYIDPQLYNIPFAIGERSNHIQDLNHVPTGARFPIEGDKVRLFMQWGEGLSAQHLDMDVSCMVIYPEKAEFCSYSQLNIGGCKHSGDIQQIPEKVGTAEYIDVDVAYLQKWGAKYVYFTSNAYTNGSLSPNMMVGWMNSEYPMTISSTGVGYHPAHIQQHIKIKEGLAKGLLFGILDIQKREMIWLEMDFSGQVVQNMNLKTVESLMQKMEARIKVGDILKLKAGIHQLTITENQEEADQVYDLKWASDPNELNQFLL